MCPRADVPHIEIQARDLLILRGLFEARIMSLEHIAAMYFDGRREAAQKRVQKLKAAGYLAERPRRPYERALTHLTRRAFDVLEKGGHLSGYPSFGWARLRKRFDVSPYTIAHETAVLDVKSAFVSAAARVPELSVAQFSTWPALLQFKAAPRQGSPEMLVKPDGFVELAEARSGGSFRHHHFFLEVDRSTEPQGTLILRAACYRNYCRQFGNAARSNQGNARSPIPFRVLFVCKTAERRDSTAEHLLLLQPPILSQVWLTTQDEVTRDPLGPIWVRPVDFRRAANGNRSITADPRRSNRTPRSVAPRFPTPQKLPLIELGTESESNLRLDL